MVAHSNGNQSTPHPAKSAQRSFHAAAMSERPRVLLICCNACSGEATERTFEPGKILRMLSTVMVATSGVFPVFPVFLGRERLPCRFCLFGEILFIFRQGHPIGRLSSMKKSGNSGNMWEQTHDQPSIPSIFSMTPMLSCRTLGRWSPIRTLLVSRSSSHCEMPSFFRSRFSRSDLGR